MHNKFDVVVVGSGAMGLWLTWVLVSRGYTVAVVEKERNLATGASTRNEGWLHRGTYHAAAIEERSLALQIARRTIVGHDLTLRFAPEAREDSHTNTYMLLGAENREETISRWAEAGVDHRPVPMCELKRLEPGLELGSYDSAFQVADVAINNRLVYCKLATELRHRGAIIFAESVISSVREGAVTIQNRDRRLQELEMDILVCAAGYGIGEFFSSTLNIPVLMRYFRSHLVDIPRFSRHCFFGIDPCGLTVMNHGNWAIVGFTKDQAKVSAPTLEPKQEDIERIKRHLRRIAPTAKTNAAIGRACTKVDIDHTRGSSRTFGNLNIAFGEPLRGVFWVLPGKMTEAPYAAHQLADVLCDRLGPRIPKIEGLSPQSNPFFVAQRPIDTYDSAVG